MKKLLLLISNIIKPSTIIWVDVYYGENEINRLKYTGIVKLPKNEYFKETLLSHFDSKISKPFLTDGSGSKSYISDDKKPLYDMIRMGLEKKLKVKIISISVLRACTI